MSGLSRTLGPKDQLTISQLEDHEYGRYLSPGVSDLNEQRVDLSIDKDVKFDPNALTNG